MFMSNEFFADDECEWGSDDVSRRRKVFCNKLEGYGSVCSCKNPAPLTFDPEPVSTVLLLFLST